MALLEPGCLVGRDDVLDFNENLIEKWLNAVAAGEFEKKFPANGLTQQRANAVCLFLAGNFGTYFGTRSEEDGPLGVECGIRSGHVLGWTRWSESPSGYRARRRITNGGREGANLYQIRLPGACAGKLFGQHVRRGNSGSGKRLLAVLGRRAAHVAFHIGKTRTAGAAGNMGT